VFLDNSEIIRGTYGRRQANLSTFFRRVGIRESSVYLTESILIQDLSLRP